MNRRRPVSGTRSRLPCQQHRHPRHGDSLTNVVNERRARSDRVEHDATVATEASLDVVLDVLASVARLSLVAVRVPPVVSASFRTRRGERPLGQVREDARCPGSTADGGRKHGAGRRAHDPRKPDGLGEDSAHGWCCYRKAGRDEADSFARRWRWTSGSEKNNLGIDIEARLYSGAR